MGKTLYAVSSGIYSAYRIVAIFDKKELAEQFLTRVSDPNNIEEYELNAGVEAMQKGYIAFRVEMMWNGDTTRVDVVDFTSPIYNHYVLYPEWDSKGKKNTGRNILRVLTWARSKKHAVKIANEKRTQLIAEGWHE